MKRVVVQKRDLLWLLVPLLCGGLLLVQRGRNEPVTAEILVDGRVVASYPVTNEAAQTITLSEVPGVTILLEHGSVRLTQSDCPDRRCVRAGAISKPGELLICLPNRLVIQLVGKQQEADVIIG